MSIWNKTPKEIEEAVTSATRCFEVSYSTLGADGKVQATHTQEVWGRDSTVATNLGLWLHTQGYKFDGWKEI